MKEMSISEGNKYG